MTEEEMQEFITKKEMQEFIRQEIEKQTRGILKKSTRSKIAVEDFELMPGHHQETEDYEVTDIDSIETPETQETTVLLGSSFDTMNTAEQIKKIHSTNRLETTADSLLDIRLERLKTSVRAEERRKLFNHNNRAIIQSNMDVHYPRTREEMWRHRVELYCLYAIYFFLVFCAFYFAVFYAWAPILKGIKQGKSKPNVSIYNNHNFNKYNNF